MNYLVSQLQSNHNGYSKRKFKGGDNMKIFTLLVLASGTASFIVGIVTQDIFHGLSLYSPLSLLSIVVKDTLENRKLRRKYKLGEK